jgi:hypothetical protein
MSFWTEVGGKDPKRNFRFRVTIGGFTRKVCWWAKKVQKPNYSIAEVKHVYLGHTYYYPGKLEWQEITMALVDPAEQGESGVDALRDLNKIIEASGYELPTAAANTKTMSKDKASGAQGGLGSVMIEQLDADGNPIETWTLKNPFLKKVSFSELDYENDDLTTIDIALRYDWAECVIAGSEDAFFNSAVPQK